MEEAEVEVHQEEGVASALADVVVEVVAASREEAAAADLHPEEEVVPEAASVEVGAKTGSRDHCLCGTYGVLASTVLWLL